MWQHKGFYLLITTTDEDELDRLQVEGPTHFKYQGPLPNYQAVHVYMGDNGQMKDVPLLVRQKADYIVD